MPNPLADSFAAACLVRRFSTLVCGTFFNCPLPGCKGMCRNGTLVQQEHFVCEQCFTRFAKVDEHTVETVEVVQVDPRVLGALEVLASAGTVRAQTSYSDFHHAATMIPLPFYLGLVQQFEANHGYYKATHERVKALLSAIAGLGVRA